MRDSIRLTGQLATLPGRWRTEDRRTPGQQRNARQMVHCRSEKRGRKRSSLSPLPRDKTTKGEEEKGLVDSTGDQRSARLNTSTHERRSRVETTKKTTHQQHCSPRPGDGGGQPVVSTSEDDGRRGSSARRPRPAQNFFCPLVEQRADGGPARGRSLAIPDESGSLIQPTFFFPYFALVVFATYRFATCAQ